MGLSNLELFGEGNSKLEPIARELSRDRVWVYAIARHAVTSL